MGDKKDKSRPKRNTMDGGGGSNVASASSKSLGVKQDILTEVEEHLEDPGAAALSESVFIKALENLRQDIYDKLDSKIDTVTQTLRSEMLLVKTELKVTLTSLQTTVNAQGATIRELEESATVCSDDITSLQSTVRVLKDEVNSLKVKCEDLEGRSRRNNIRLIGVPEGFEMPHPRESVSQLLKDILKLDEAPLLDRAHRTLREKPKTGAPPRPLIIRVHYFHVKEQILRRAGAAAPLLFQGNKLFIFPDFAPSVAKKRLQFVNVKRLLHTCSGVKFGLFYPAELRITLPDGVVRKFTDPAAAADFVTKDLKDSAS